MGRRTWLRAIACANVYRITYERVAAEGYTAAAPRIMAYRWRELVRCMDEGDPLRFGWLNRI